jgi:hypothetical protein
MMDFTDFKMAMMIASQIMFILFIVVWLFPFVPVFLAWGYSFFVVFAWHKIVRSHDSY